MRSAFGQIYLLGSSLRGGASLLGALLMLAACADNELILKGEREAVLLETSSLVIDDGAAAEFGAIGSAITNQDAGHPGLSAGHAGGHLTLETPLKRVWRSRVAAPEDDVVSLPQPMIADGRIYALGADALLTAFDLESGDVFWQFQVNAPDSGLFPGKAGGIATNGEVVAVHAARDSLSLLDVKNGSEIWRVEHDSPLAGGPTLIDNAGVVVTDIDGYVFVYRLADGELAWQSVGLPVDTVVFGAPSPAVSGAELVLAGAGGEIAIQKVENGQLLWADSLATLSPTTPLQELGDVLAHPIHDGENIYVISQSGLLSAYESKTGFQIWEHPIAGVQMPWIAGDSLFVLSVEGHVIALRKSDGAVRWMTALDGSGELGSAKPGTVTEYFGPVVASGMVHVLSEGGKLVSLNAETGAEVSSQSLGSKVNIPPQIAQSSFIYLTESGQLNVMR
ncbi:MAG: PQQ-binding-like beta-propeller repeat protein [Alphaproteobacteria bacterium]|nr:PQQ-binding-like beta-propeller repeat protein [Alphaproteobacteria bacterium]MBL6777331.1 PQQ-binding-like beta-propeller repeat protein [Alphaproteobacteria bacterium]